MRNISPCLWAMFIYFIKYLAIVADRTLKIKNQRDARDLLIIFLRKNIFLRVKQDEICK